jgi:adenosine deaminase
MKDGITPAFLARIPKTDLHVHLDGSLRIPTLIELAKEAKVDLPSYEESGLRERVFKENYKDLPEYLAGFAYTCAVMQTPENVERVAYEIAIDNLEENVRYLEVRFGPQLHIREGFTMREVLLAVHRGLNRAKQEHNLKAEVQSGADLPFEYGIIVCALRWFNPHMSSYYHDLFHVMKYARPKTVFATASLELARASVALRDREGLPIVGFDLAGAESGNPAGDHEEAFQYAHRNFIKKTVHAGEAYGPESIFQALTDCHANRIGHGTFLFAAERIVSPHVKDHELYVEQLVNYIASQRISVEVNLTSNLQTLPEIEDVASHPLRLMMEHGLSASICTDNRLVSNTTVTRELALACEHLPIDRKRLRNLIVAGFKGSFFPGSYTEKRRYVRQAINFYESIEREMLDA